MSSPYDAEVISRINCKERDKETEIRNEIYVEKDIIVLKFRECSP